MTTDREAEIARLTAALAEATKRAEVAEVERDHFQAEVKLRNRIPATGNAFAELTRRAEAAEAALAQSRAETQAALAGCVKIKPLVWMDIGTRSWDAVGAGKLYRVIQRKNGTASLRTAIHSSEGVEYASPAAAKAAAQADHDSSIRATIQPDTSKLALVAWRVRERPGFEWRLVCGDPSRDPTLRGHECQPLYITAQEEPRHD